MRTLYCLLFILLFANNGWAKTIPFYVPPVMRIDLDPEEWNLPYLLPDYFHAKSFQPGSPVLLKARSFNLEIRIQIKYLTEAEQKQWATYSSDYKVAKDIKNFGDFEAFQTRYIDVKNTGELVWVSKKNTNIYILISTNAKVNDPVQVQLTHEFLSHIRWVDPSEIDRFIGYPLDQNKASEIASTRKPWLNQSDDPYRRLQPKDVMRDVTHGFSYAKYHKARLQIAREEVPLNQKEAYALGFTHLEPWYLIDSMAPSTSSNYGVSSNAINLFNQLSAMANSRFKPFKKMSLWVQSDTLTIALLSCDTLSEVWVNKRSPNGQLSIQRSALPAQRWIRENVWLKKENTLEEKTAVIIPPHQSRFVAIALESSQPTPQGLQHFGKKYYFLDTHATPLKWTTHTTYFGEAECQMIVRQTLPEPGQYSSSPYYRITEIEHDYAYAYDLISKYDNPDFEMQKKAWEERCLTNPKDIVVQSGDLTLDLNTNQQTEYWQIWIRNGAIVFGSGIEISNTGLTQMNFESYLPLLNSNSVIKKLLEDSKVGYTAFSNYKATDFAPRPASESQYGRHFDQPQTLPFASIYTENAAYCPYAFLSEDVASNLKSLLVYPEALKKKKIGGMIAVEIEINSDGSIRPLSAQVGNSSMQPLADEAIRLTHTIQKLRTIHEIPAGVSLGKSYLLYYFQP